MSTGWFNPVLGILSVRNVLVALFIVVFSWKLTKAYQRRRQVVKCVNDIPSLNLKFYQIFGHLTAVIRLRLFGTSTDIPAHVYEFLAAIGYNYALNKDGITSIWHFGYPFISVFKAATVETILGHTSELKKAWFYKFFQPWLGSGLFTSSGETWKVKRKLLTPSFHFDILKNFLPVFNKQSNILLDVLRNYTEEKYVDILPVVSKCSLDIMFESIMGKPTQTQTQSSSPHVDAVVCLTCETWNRMQKPWLWNDFFFNISPTGKKYRNNVEMLHDLLKDLIEEKKRLYQQKSQSKPVTTTNNSVSVKRKNLALLDLLLHEHLENNSLSEEDVREEVNAFAFAGHDTTSMALSWSLYMIGLHPWVQEKIHQELDSIFYNDRDATIDDIKDMKYLDCVIKESMRLYPPVPAVARMVTTDIRFLDKYTVPKDSTIFVLTYLLHRDPEVFPNPEKFDPERFSPENSACRNPFAFVPFSAGPRNCIGQRFALMEQKVVLSSILRKYKIRSLDPRDKVNVVQEIVLRPVKELRLQIRQRDRDFDFRSVYYFP